MKTVDAIYNEMMGVFASKTGLEAAGSGDMAVRLYAVAAQVYALFVQTGWVERQCFPQTAEGEFLDRHAELRGLERRAATAAEGVIQFAVSTAGDSDRMIPKGTVCMTAGLVRFETLEAGVLPAGQTVTEVRAGAVTPGAAGNVAAGSILSMAVAPVGVSRCVNPAAFTGGADREGDEALRLRVMDSFRRLPNGANAAFYEQGAMSFDGVAAVQVIPRSRGVGTVDVVVTSPTGLPSEALLGELGVYFQKRREIAVDVVVRAPVLKTINVAVQVKAEAGRDAATVRLEAERVLRGYFDGRILGRSILRARLGELLFQVEGIENYAISTPAADVAIELDELPQLGTLTVEALT